jgi:hypothetical protein
MCKSKFQGKQSRTVYFNLTVIEGTNPYFVIDFNDSSPIGFPSNISINKLYNFSHIYPQSGYYNVNITVFNLVSTVSKIVRVINMILLFLFTIYLILSLLNNFKVGLMSPYSDFDCKLKYRLHDNNDAFDYDQIYDSTFQVYKVRREFNLRFFCSWSNLGELKSLFVWKMFLYFK